jgi:DNA-binding transcriptional LysR family regulator
VDLVQHLRYFLVVAEELHFGRAAQRLYMAQPPLSQRIRRLEKEYGTPLFDRSGGKVRLTPAGEALRGEAEQIVARVDRSRDVVREAAAGTARPLRVGVPPETPGRVLAALATECATAHTLLELTTVEQVRRLATGELDVGLLRQPVTVPGLSLGPATAVAQGVVVARTSPLAARVELALGELADHDLILFPREAAPGAYEETLRICRDHGFVPARVHHASSPEFVLGLVAAGQGITFEVSALAAKEPRVRWVPIRDDPLAWRISAAWTSAHPGAPAFARLVAVVLRRDLQVLRL